MSNEYVHNLFWAGIENDHDISLGFLKKTIVDQSFLKNFKKPYFIYTGNSRIESLENLKLSDDTISRLNTQELHIFFYEPLCLKINNKYNFTFYSEIPTTADDISCDSLDSILIFIKNNDLKSVKLYVTDCNTAFLQRFYPTLDIFTLDLYLLQISADLSNKPLIENNFTKKFWCGNKRYTTHRHLIMSKLTTIEGNYSWPYLCDLDTLKKNSWFSDYNAVEKNCELLNQKTFFIDNEIPKIKITDFYHNYNTDTNGTITEKLLESYADSFCAVVNETRFAQPLANISEKTIWPLYYRMPVLVVGAPYCLYYLRSLGFKTFNYWWDESYDLILDHEKRIKKIFEIIDYINKKSIKELKDIYQEMTSVLEHNHNVAINLKNTLSNII